MAVLRKIRIGTDITLGITVMASGHAVDWDSQDIKHVYAFSDVQGQPVAEMSYEQRGSTLRCVFHAEDQNYVGAYRVIIEFNDGSAFSSTLDMPAFEIVRTSEEADIDTGEVVLDIDGSMRFYSLAEVISKLEGLHAEVKAAASAAREASGNANAAATKANDAAALANSNASKAEASNKVINDNERKRIAQETARESAEADRQRAELERQKGDESIATKEAVRERNEEVRETNEQTREDNELERRNAESARSRAETQRASSETKRISNETSRQAAENKRAAAETSRQEAETARVKAEAGRVTEFARLKKESEEATKAASAVSDVVADHTVKINELEADIKGRFVEAANLSDSIASKIGGITLTGARGSSSNYTNYYFNNDDYSKVSAFVGAEKNTDYVGIAFYKTADILNDDSLYESSFITGVPFDSSVELQCTYEANVPKECKVIVISCRTALFPSPTASLFKFSKGLEERLADKVDKVAGKGLSTNDYSDKDKAILYGVENYDDVSVGSGAGSAGIWTYAYKKFKNGQKLRIIMFTPTGLTLPADTETSSTCITMAYQTTNGQYKQNLLYRQGYDYPIRKGLINEGVITIEGGDIEYVRMFAVCQTTEKFGFIIQAIEDNAVNKCYAPSKMVHKFNALSFDSVDTSGRVGIYTFNFLHFSDIHKNEVELKRIREFSKLYEPYLCDVINTGDSVKGLGTEDFAWYAENGSKFLNVIGNHDSATSQSSSSGWTGLGKQATYDKFIAPFIANWGVSHTDGNNYYYKDYVSSRNYGGEQKWVKLRLVVLDCMFYDEAQNTWLTTTLSDANANGFDVIIAIHASPAETDAIPCTYTSIDSFIQPAGWASYSTANAIQVVKNFIDNGGKFVCWLGGHVHHDMMGKITEDNRQLVVLVETCSNNEQEGFDRPYIEGEFEYADAFNIIGVDTYRHILKLFKVGYEYDSAMRRKGTFVYDYEKHSVVFNG